MWRAHHFAGCTALAAFVGAFAAEAAPGDKPGWELTFQDEFDGASLDLSKWKRRYKWGEAVINGELQAYVDDAFVLQNGILTIVGTKASGQYAGKTMSYRSGVICSIHEQTYGYFEAKVRVPKGQGFWPAFWLLKGATSAPGIAEIDVLEILGHETDKLHMNVHWGESYTTGHQSDAAEFKGPDFAAEFHVFGVEWTSSSIKWTVDGTERHSHTGAGVPQVPMYIILNLAIGGGWPGAPDSTTVFPGKYEIDYVRAYKPASTDAGPDGSAGAPSTGGATSTGGTTSSGGATSSGGTPSSGGATSSGGASTGGTGGAAASDSSGDDSGCGCRAAGRDRSTLASLGALLALAFGLRRSLCRRR